MHAIDPTMFVVKLKDSRVFRLSRLIEWQEYPFQGLLDLLSDQIPEVDQLRADQVEQIVIDGGYESPWIQE